MKYERLRNLVMLVLVAAYFASVYLGKRAKLVILVSHIQRAAKRIYGVPEFRFYAIADGIKQLLFGRNTGIAPPRPDPRLNLFCTPATGLLLKACENDQRKGNAQ